MRIDLIIRLFSATAIFAAMWSCSHDYFVPEQKPRESQGGDFAVAISAGNDIGTRTFLDVENPQNGVYPYYWEPNDKVGLAATVAGDPYDTVWDYVELTSNNEVLSTLTTFTGELTSSQWSGMDTEGSYDYYSWHPQDLSKNGLTVSFTTPTVLTPDLFVPDAPMIARATNESSIAYLASYPNYANMVQFDYQHVMSYIAIEPDFCPSPQQQTIIGIAVHTDNPGDKIWGTFSCDMTTGNLTGGGNSTSFSIPEGVAVGPNAGILYIPVAPGDYSGSNFIFTFTVANGPQIVKTIPGTNFERANIHRLRVSIPAFITGSGNFTIKPGLYYIETWGGNGGYGEGGAPGGLSQRVAGLYEFTTTGTMNVYVGMAGYDSATQGSGGTQATQGGSNGSTEGRGGYGAGGGTRNGSANAGGNGGGGGAGTFVLINNNFSSPLIVSGGGGGGGGKAYATNNKNGGAGGNGGVIGVRDGLGSNGNPGDGNSPGSAGGGGTAGMDPTSGTNGGDGYAGENSSTIIFVPYAGGGGGGGGGGGYTLTTWGGTNGVWGGGNGAGGGRRSSLNVAGGGGGGVGGSSYVSSAGKVNTPPAYITLPADAARPIGRTDGYVVITYFRPL